MRRIIITSLLVVAMTAMAAATSPRDEIAARLTRSASNHYNYPFPELPMPTLTPAPVGYEPFHIEHYGRHGSRWSTSMSTYTRPVKEMEKAERNHQLTDLGRATLATLRAIREAAQGREGELSDVGAEQHRGIAERMFRNFPQVFSGDAQIDARSTIIVRCILSMLNETQTLQGLNPQLRITADASVYDMPYMGWGYGEDTCANKLRARMKLISDSVKMAWNNADRFAAQLFIDPGFVADSIRAKSLMLDVFDVAGGLQDIHRFDSTDLYHLFTTDEIYNLWRANNVKWYVNWGPAPANGSRLPFIERALLANIIRTADEAIATGRRGAALRFGHETCVLPLACLLEIDDVNLHTTDLDNLHNLWRCYDIIPMACNIQMVFYRPTDRTQADDVLVKVLFNEHEARLPIATDRFPYYRWADVKPYYEQKLRTVIDWTN